MRQIPWSRVMERANGDGEFRIAARFWRTTLRFDLGSESVRFTVDDGVIRTIAPSGPGADCTVSVAGSRESWERLLAAVPLWQDLLGAVLRADFVVTAADPEAFYAYYPAVRRLVDLVREESRS